MQTLFIYGLMIMVLLLGVLWLLWHVHRSRRVHDHAHVDHHETTIGLPTTTAVPGIVVSDTTPITHLAAIGYLDLLRGLYGSIMLPAAVYQELTAFGSPGAAEAREYTWITIHRVEQTAVQQLLQDERDLNRGEAEAIILVQEVHAQRLIIDDRPGRQAAEARGITIIGTLGVLRAARDEGLIDTVRPISDALIQSGFYVNPAFYAQFLADIGEDPTA